MNGDQSYPAPVDPGRWAALLPAPVERDLPVGRHQLLKEYLMREINAAPPPPAVPAAVEPAAPVPAPARRPRRPVWAAAAGVAVVAAAAVAAGTLGHDPGRPRVFAFGVGAVSPRLRQAIDLCTDRARQVEPGTTPRLVNRGEAGDYAIAVFLTPTRMITCDTGPTGAGLNYGPYGQQNWLPGPISVQGAGSTEANGGDVFVAGRISARVARVELAHGDGSATVARLSDGTFAVATNGAHIAAGAALLVSYDRGGQVIDRRPALYLENTRSTPDGRYAETCWLDPAGTAVYGVAGPDCGQAERWR